MPHVTGQEKRTVCSGELGWGETTGLSSNGIPPCNPSPQLGTPFFGAGHPSFWHWALTFSTSGRQSSRVTASRSPGRVRGGRLAMASSTTW